MDEIGVGFLLAFGIMFCSVMFFLFGQFIGRESIIDQCNAFGKFQLRGDVYTCEKAKKQ